MTPDEKEELEALSLFLRESMAEMIRRWHRQERRQLIDAGRKPPKRLRETT